MKNLKTVVAVAALFLAGAVVSGCAGLFGAAKTPEVDVFECQLDVLVDAVPRPVAEDVVMALRARNYEYAVRQLLALGLDRARIEALADAYNACLPASPAEPVQPEGV